MNKPLASWNKTLRTLGFRLNWDGFLRTQKLRKLNRQQEELSSRQFNVENLEERQMLSAVTSSFSNGDLVVVGTSNNDSIFCVGESRQRRCW